MTAYRNVEVKESFSTFVSVPEDKLLRDIPRIDRAIGIVVAPLAFSPEERKAKEGAAAAPKSTHKKKDKNMVEPAPATVLPPLPEGVVANGESPFIVPREQILAQTKTVVLMPVLVGGVPRDKETTVATRYRQYITADLHRLGITVVDPGKLLEAWNQEIGKNNFYDPYTGEFDKERHSAVRRAAYARAKRDTPFDAVIWPTILRRTAEYSYGDAVWDGVKQNLASVESSWTSSGGAVGGSGSVHAVSLYLKLCDTNDNELYRSVGGIQLIEKVSSGGLYASANKSEPLTPSQLFSDPQRDATAVHIALRSLVFTPEELDELLHPKPPESEKKGKKKY
jgi:hypothetical protein